MLKILLVDDNPGDHRLFKDAIAEAKIDCQLSFAISAEEGIRTIDTLRPDLIFMDVLMPGGSGEDFVRKLHENLTTKSIPVVFLTGVVEGNESAGVLQKLNVGGVLYSALGKPVNSQGIREAISKVKI